jgi:ABC-type bacteriocin/lantibiotic exporter with double-glycine peptidase domain
MGVTSSLSGFTSAFIGGLGPLIVLWYGGREVVANHLTLGTLIAFNVVIGYLFGPAQRLMNVNADLQQSLASLERVSELLHITPEITEPSQPMVWNPVLGGIEFQRVTFGYDRNNPILNGISFNILPERRRWQA